MRFSWQRSRNSKILTILLAVVGIACIIALAYFYSPQRVAVYIEDFSSYLNANCTDGSISIPAGKSFNCSGPLEAFQCGFFYKPSFRNLTPNYPVLGCRKEEMWSNQSSEGVFRVRGWGWQSGLVFVTDYVIYRDGAFELIKSEDGFRRVFSPVESKEEALDFIEALNKGVVVSDTTQIIKDIGEYLVSKESLKPTTVKETGDGFIVNVYDNIPSCFTDTASELVLLVKRNGEITTISSTLVWKVGGYRCIA
jgi:hypothetical protein